ncbi:ATP synthase subunit 5 [Desarmillaria ectypa]|nr:ATP synthase subunit 5 [Desarmillaria ectypa]
MLLSSAARAVKSAPAFGRRAASAISTKYASAAFGAALAKSSQTLTKVEADLTSVSKLLKSDANVREFVHNPTLSAKQRKTELAKMFSTLDAGAKKDATSDITKNLLAVLSENGRLGELEGVIEGFNALAAEHRGELTVVVTSAAPLPRDILTRLETTLKQSQAAQKAQVLKVTNKVNSNVLGGIVVDFGDKTIDLSVQSRVTKLNSIIQRKSLLHTYLLIVLMDYHLQNRCNLSCHTDRNP